MQRIFMPAEVPWRNNKHYKERNIQHTEAHQHVSHIKQNFGNTQHALASVITCVTSVIIRIGVSMSTSSICEMHIFVRHHQ